MRIAIDARYLSREFSGIATHSENVVRHVVSLDPDNQYIIFVHQSFNRALDLPDNAEVIQAPGRPVSLFTLFQMGRLVREVRADIFHALFPVTPLFLKVPTIVTVHDLQALVMPEFSGRRFYPLQKAYELFYHTVYPSSIRRARYLIAVSHATRREMAFLIPETMANTIVIYPGIDPDFGAPVDEETLRQTVARYMLPERFALYIGNTRPNKNLPGMIRAFARMIAERDGMEDLRFVLVVQEDRFFEESRRLIRRLALESRIRICGQISEVEKRCFYDRASALFLATRHEGFGHPLIEAQACGLPVLAGNHASLPEIANQTALLCDTQDERNMADNLFRILTDEPLRQRLIEGGRKNIQRFRWDECARNIVDMYHHLF